MLSAARSTGMLVAKGPPCARRHWLQWQTWMGASAPRMRKRRPPHRQAPWVMGSLSVMSLMSQPPA
jgi:hypothetical protein